MRRLYIAIDGACRKNGSPDCTSSGGVFIRDADLDTCVVLSNFEHGSTNQRGEMLALLTALDFVCQNDCEANIVTDSEYLFKAVTRDWCDGWHAKGWVTALGEPVKNKDIWIQIMQQLHKCGDRIAIYHIKGHCIPFGKVTAAKLLDADPTGKELYKAALVKYHDVREAKQDKLLAAQELSVRNNGYELPAGLLMVFVALNVVADSIATYVVEKAHNPS